MKRIKDFLYNWNDLVIVLVILTAAVAVIYWRVDIIMDYPKALAVEIQEGTATGLDIELPPEDEADSSEASTTEGTTSSNGETDSPQSSGTAAPQDTTDGASTDETSDEPKVKDPADSDIWKDGKLTKEITVVTGEGSATEAAQSLVDAGLFTSYENFEEVCIAYGFEATDIKASEFLFKKGYTQKRIAEEVTKPME